MAALKKTNAMRMLEKNHVEYGIVTYDLGDAEFSGEAVGDVLKDIPADGIFKTLTAKSDKGGFFVFVIPITAELDLKKAAASAGEKRVELLAVKDLLKTTGYMRGEVSPVGMKKQYPTYVDTSAMEKEKILVSAGKKGCSVSVRPAELVDMLDGAFAELVRTSD